MIALAPGDRVCSVSGHVLKDSLKCQNKSIPRDESFSFLRIGGGGGEDQNKNIRSFMNCR